MQVIDIPPDLGGTEFQLSFSPDGRHLVAESWRGGLLLDTTEIRWLPKVPGRSARFVRGGRDVAYLGYTTGFTVDDFHTRERRGFLPLHGHGLVATPDGEAAYILVQEAPNQLRRYDLTALEPRGTLGRHESNPDVLVGSADGRRLATWTTFGDAEPVRVWNTADIDRPDAEAVEVPMKGALRGFALSADSSRLATVSQQGVSLWDTTTGAMVLSSGKHRRGVMAVAFSPTRPLMATGDTAGNVFFWDFAGRVLARYDWGLKAAYSLAFSPDGLRCATVNSEKVVIWDVDV